DTVSFQPGGLIYSFETLSAKKKMSIIAWGAPWEYPAGTMLKFQKLYFDNVRNHGSIPLLDWSSMAPGGAAQPKYKLTNITRGDFDAFITQWATDAKNWAHPLFLRFDWEMNGNWQFPWSSQLNGNKPADYIAAWRHVHDIFTRVGANNVTWVWAPNISTWNTIPLAQLYPGASYVDWVGLDGYNFYTKQAMPWETFSQIYSGAPTLVSNSKDSYTEITNVAPGKPLMITEFASVEFGDGGTKKAQWITDALSSAIPNRYPAIKAIVYFNWNAGNPALTWPVGTSVASKNAFATAIANPLYLANIFNTLANVKIAARR
ncbi:MAG: glycosyl hydrolase, partial [Chloroflexota bacterium]